MNEDIVTRLRALISDLRKTVPQTVMIEAADEIENARAEVTYWKHRTEQLARYIKRQQDVPNKGCRCVACKVIRDLERATNNE